MKTGQEAVSTTTDMPTRSYGIASSCGDGHSVTFEEIEINLSQLLSRADPIPSAIRKFARRLQKTKIENYSTRIVDNEIFIAMATAAHRWTQPGVYGAL
jgi:hypothetical protein